VAPPARRPEAGKKRKREEEKEVDGEDGRRSGDVKGKGKTKAVEEMIGKKRKTGDEDTFSDSDDEREDDDQATKKVIVVSRGGDAGEQSQAPKAKITRKRGRPTGEYHESPCEHCKTVRKGRCEKDAGRGACVSCKRGKRACEHSHVKFRRKGSDAEPAESGAAPKSRVVKAAGPAP
jgi:hypothetical protein